MSRIVSDEKRTEIADRLYQERKRLGLTQRKMADRIGIGITSYQRAEQGRFELAAATLFRIMKTAGLEISLTEDELMTGDAASLRYWIRTMRAVRNYMDIHHCTAEKAVAEMCFPLEDQKTLLRLIRNNQQESDILPR